MIDRFSFAIDGNDFSVAPKRLSNKFRPKSQRRTSVHLDRVLCYQSVSSNSHALYLDCGVSKYSSNKAITQITLPKKSEWRSSKALIGVSLSIEHRKDSCTEHSETSSLSAVALSFSLSVPLSLSPSFHWRGVARRQRACPTSTKSDGIHEPVEGEVGDKAKGVAVGVRKG